MSENIQYLQPVQYARVVLKLSQQIAQLAEIQNWEAAREMETERQNVMQALFSHPDINEALPAMSGLLEQVMQLDAEVILRGESELQQMAVQLNQLGRGKRAVNAYLKT